MKVDGHHCDRQAINSKDGDTPINAGGLQAVGCQLGSELEGGYKKVQHSTTPGEARSYASSFASSFREDDDDDDDDDKDDDRKAYQFRVVPKVSEVSSNKGCSKG